MNITAGLVPHLSIYDVRDYRRFLFAHLQLLSGLCTLSMRSVNDSIGQLLSSQFVTAELLPREAFDEQIGLAIEQTKSDAPSKLTHLLSLLRVTNHGNAIITAYGTNFQYIDLWYNKTLSVAITRPVLYDDKCSCASVANCTTQASFINRDSSEIVPVIGLKMGCTPSESFLLSTLECFHNPSCISDIRQNINGFNADSYTVDLPLAVSPNGSRFSINSTIIDLVRHLFIEDWSVATDYSAYFNQCSPILCTYTYTQQVNSLYTITTLLGLCGGLTFILKWICPNIVHLLIKVNEYRKKQKSVVTPGTTAGIATVETISAIMIVTNPHTIRTDLKLVSTVPMSVYAVSSDCCTHSLFMSFFRTQLCSSLMRCLIFGIVLFGLMIAVMVVISIYFNRSMSSFGMPAGMNGFVSMVGLDETATLRFDFKIIEYLFRNQT